MRERLEQSPPQERLTKNSLPMKTPANSSEPEAAGELEPPTSLLELESTTAALLEEKLLPAATVSEGTSVERLPLLLLAVGIVAAVESST